MYLEWLVIRLLSSRIKCGHICECWKSTQEFNSWCPHRFGKLFDQGVQTLRQFHYHSGDGPLWHCQVGACSTMQNVSHMHHCVSQLAGTRTSIINPISDQAEQPLIIIPGHSLMEVLLHKGPYPEWCYRHPWCQWYRCPSRDPYHGPGSCTEETEINVNICIEMNLT